MANKNKHGPLDSMANAALIMLLIVAIVVSWTCYVMCFT